MPKVTPQDILADIEFELMQGVIASDELGRGVVALRQYQNKIRNEIFQIVQLSSTQRDILNRQFRLNDMLITLIQEMVLVIQATQQDIRRIRGVAENPILSPPKPCTADGTEQYDIGDSLLKEIDSAIKPDALWVDIPPYYNSLPLIGWFITRLRMFLHRLAAFYVHRLADKQSPINRTFADALLTLVQLCREQQAQIATLETTVALLQAQQPSSTENTHNANRH